MKLKYFLIFFCIHIGNKVYSQFNDINELGKFEVQYVSPILEDNVIKGYFMFTRGDNISKSETTFYYTLLDIDLKIIKTHELTYPKRVIFLDFKHNGNKLCIAYYDFPVVQQKNPDYEYLFDFIDENGDRKTIKRFFKNKENIKIERGGLLTDLDENPTIIPVTNKGFIFHFTKRTALNSSENYEAYDNNGKLLWMETNIIGVKVSGDLVMVLKFNGEHKKGFYPSINTNLRKFEGTSEFSYDHIVNHTNEYIQYVYDFIKVNDDYFIIKSNFKLDPTEKLKWGPNYTDNPDKYIFIKINAKTKEETEYSLNGNFDIDKNPIIQKKLGSFNDVNDKFILRKVEFMGDKFYMIGEKYNADKSIQQVLIVLDKELKVLDAFTRNSSLNVSYNFEVTTRQFGYRASIPTRNVVLFQSLENTNGVYFNNKFFFNSYIKDGAFAIALYLNTTKTKKVDNVFCEILNFSNENNFSATNFNFVAKQQCYLVLPAKHGYVCIFEYFEKEKKIDFRLEKLE